MNASTAFALFAGAALFAPSTHRTDYSEERSLRIESKVSLELSTNMEMEVDGEPSDRFGGGGMIRREARTTARVDTFKASADGAPTHVVRAFEDVTIANETESEMGSGSESNEAPLSGVTIELKRGEDGEVTAEVLEGEEPSDAAALEQSLSLGLDALLPSEELEEGGEAALDADAIRAALWLAVDAKLYPAPERGEWGGGERGDGERRRGPGGFGRGAGSSFQLLADADWEGTVTYAGVEDGDEGPVAVYELELSASGDLPEPEFGGGGGGRRPFALEAPRTPRVPRAGVYDVDLAGRLLYSIEARMPVRLELSGDFTSEREMERDRGDRHVTIRTDSEGDIEFVVEVVEVSEVSSGSDE